MPAHIHLSRIYNVKQHLTALEDVYRSREPSFNYICLCDIVEYIIYVCINMYVRVKLVSFFFSNLNVKEGDTFLNLR